MSKKTLRRVIDLVVEAHELAQSIGMPNLLQPGLVKELILAEFLRHKVIVFKHGADAFDPADPSIQYEYLTCKEGGTGQLDRMYKEPKEKRAESLSRITRNRKLYYAVFYKNNQIKLKAIYELDPVVVLEEAKRQLDRSKNSISHIGFGIKWVKQNGKLVYDDKAGS